MTEWITDRQPTEADGDKDEAVLMSRFHDGRSCSPSFSAASVDWRHVGPGVPWRHTSIWSPPAKPEFEPEPKPEFDFKPGQVWRTRKGMTCEIVQIDNGCKGEKPIRSNLYGLHWHYPDGKSCLATYGQDHEDDLVELIREASPVPDLAREPATIVASPRRFVSVRRTILQDGDHIIDAVDDEGVAWWRRLDTSPHHPAFPSPEPEWQQLSPLPPRQEPAQ